jgi:DNA helicase II / ATP-dependent DNA helicase PcrA
MSAAATTAVPGAMPSIRRALKGREPTAEQWAAITAPIGPVHVIAGAGSGKTAVMAARIVYLIEQLGVPPSAILALTFTNKAATELEERVRDAIGPPLADPDGTLPGPGGTAPGDAASGVIIPGLGGAWGGGHGAATRGHGDPGPGPVEPVDPIPGLGDPPPDERAAVDGLLPPGEAPADQVAVHTYHAFAADLVKAHGVRVGVEPDADLLSEAQQYQILLGLLDGERFEHLHVRTAGATIRKTLELAAACADHLVVPAAVAEHARSVVSAAEAGERMPDWQVQAARERIELTRLVQRYVEEKRRRSRIDFGDQVAKAFELVSRHGDLAEELRGRYPHVLLDEYQDTNIAQRRLMQVLCPPGASIMAVGDARQAIYAFRGATMYNLLSFGEQFPLLDGRGAPEALPLSTNFRSGRRILELANSVIDVIAEERRGGAPLVPQEGAGEGEVRAALLTDQIAEADFVADQVVTAHERGLEDGSYPEWRDVAVLVRSKRLLGPLREALERRDVPVEVVGLSGLLETPEIVDLVSVLRVIADPGDNVALARLLLGPRWRIGHRHLVRLARWASRHNWGLKDVLPGEDPDPGDVSFALSEALDHLGEVEGLDDEARGRLEAFRVELRRLRRRSDAPLLDLAQTVLERTGVWSELEASADRRSESARRNLATFLDRVAAFAPVEGDPSLGAFLAYLDAVEDAAEPVEATQPALADSVKLMTVHMAKGLEFPVVVVAGLAAGTAKDGSAKHGIFPDVRVADPRRAQGFPYELREDAGHLPRFQGNARAFRAQLDERALEDERRLLYVALTRAKRLLVLTSAWWYRGSEKVPKGPSPFWREAAEHPAVTVVARAPEPPASPLTEALRAKVSWPPPARRPDELTDPVIPEGVAAAVGLARRDPAAIAGRVPPGEVDAYQAAVDAGRQLVEASNGEAAPPTPQPPRVLSVTQVLVYARCPRDFYWTVVRPLPSPPRPAARLGSVVHRLLERRARGLPDLVDLDGLGADGSGGIAEPGLVERAKRNFAATPYASMPPPDAEVGVVLRVGPWALRGRIDAIFRTGDRVELVDWKTGKRAESNPFGLDQLGVYALALRELGQLPGDRCMSAYCYLGGDEPRIDPFEWRQADLDRQREVLETVLAALDRGEFERRCRLPTCRSCRGE